MTIKVVNVAKGVATLKVTVGPITNNGHQVKPADTAEAKIDSMGRSVAGPAVMMMGGTYPEKPVKVGETWTSTFPMGQLGGNATAKFILRGLKTMKGRKVAGLASDIPIYRILPALTSSAMAPMVSSIGVCASTRCW